MSDVTDNLTRSNYYVKTAKAFFFYYYLFLNLNFWPVCMTDTNLDFKKELANVHKVLRSFFAIALSPLTLQVSVSGSFAVRDRRVYYFILSFGTLLFRVGNELRQYRKWAKGKWKTSGGSNTKKMPIWRSTDWLRRFTASESIHLFSFLFLLNSRAFQGTGVVTTNTVIRNVIISHSRRFVFFIFNIWNESNAQWIDLGNSGWWGGSCCSASGWTGYRF